MHKKTRTSELLWLLMLRQLPLFATESPQDAFSDGRPGNTMRCLVQGCHWPRDCLREVCPFDTGPVQCINPRTVIRG
jgi:hypothetical protein